MRPIDADALPIRKAYIVDEAGFGATFYVVDIEDIDCAPTIDAAPVVHGRWVHTDMAAWWFGKDECSECQYHDDERNDLSRLKYCPNCGAKMDGGS